MSVRQRKRQACLYIFLSIFLSWLFISILPIFLSVFQSFFLSPLLFLVFLNSLLSFVHICYVSCLCKTETVCFLFCLGFCLSSHYIDYSVPFPAHCFSVHNILISLMTCQIPLHEGTVQLDINVTPCSKSSNEIDFTRQTR